MLLQGGGFFVDAMSWKLRAVFTLLIVMLLGLQYRLWVGEGSLAEVRALKKQLARQKAQLQELEKTNQALRAEVQSLKNDDAAIEARARRELGMIREGETYFQLIRPESGEDE